MTPLRWSRNMMGLACAMLVLAVIALVSAGAPAAAAPATPQDSYVALGENSAEITLPWPTRYVVLLHEAGKVRTLHARGEVVFHPQNPGQSVMIERIDAETIFLRVSSEIHTRPQQVGMPIPGFPGLVLASTVVLERVEYRSRVVPHLSQPDPVVLALEGSHAIVEVEVLGSAAGPAPTALAPVDSSGTDSDPESLSAGVLATEPPDAAPRPKLDATLFEEIPVKAVDANTYVVDATTVQPAIENVGQVLADLEPRLTPAFSFRSGVSFDLTSAVVDGTLNGAGFTVTNPKVAERFGIQVGDIITQFNGHAVNSILEAWMAFQEFIIRNPLQSLMQVDLQRAGLPMTKMYQIR